MIKPRFLISIAAAFIGLIFFSANAQTTRISCGKNANGQQTYIEVYEYDYVTEKPQFPGGDGMLIHFINDQRVYPQKAYQNGIQGRVTCSFVVRADGSVSNIHILKGVEQSLNNEALRILSAMPQWTPGKINGHAVPVRVIRCVPFRK